MTTVKPGQVWASKNNAVRWMAVYEVNGMWRMQHDDGTEVNVSESYLVDDYVLVREAVATASIVNGNLVVEASPGATAEDVARAINGVESGWTSHVEGTNTVTMTQTDTSKMPNTLTLASKVTP